MAPDKAFEVLLWDSISEHLQFLAENLLPVRDRSTAPTKKRCRCEYSTGQSSTRAQRCRQLPAVSEVGHTSYVVTRRQHDVV